MSNILNYFEKTVCSFPNKTAIADNSNTFTYTELMEASKKLGYTISQISDSNKAIGVFVNRGAETVILFLGVAYSGNFYIPIDPDMPLAKIQTILDDTNCSVLVGDKTNQQVLNQLSFTGEFITLEDVENKMIETPSLPPDTPLYMVYTSGSTGKPKGVLKSHGSVVSYINAFIDTFGFDSNEIIGNQTPFFFDGSAKDIYLMLFTGATLEVIPSEIFSYPVNTVEYLNEKKITYACWVPTALALLTQLHAFKKVLPKHLRRVYFVGEVFPIKQLKKWLEFLPNIQYVNLYGFSEIAGISTYYELPKDISDIDVLPMGKPLSNCNIFLYGDGGIITEPNILGEIFISSNALALEYYNDTDKTADRFIKMTFPNGELHRVFKSGDLARYDQDGNLVFVTRNDFQIKHMGHRIELGEIESAADKLEEIQRCCCTYDNEKRIIKMFCELIPECNWDSKAVLNALSGKLSDYMFPRKVVIMDKLPINSNGKIDRAKLKEMK